MARYQTPFGTNTLTGNGGNVTNFVHNNFGPRDAGETVGVNKVEGMKEELVIDLTPELINQGQLIPFVLPAGAVIKDVYIDVETAFDLSGTTPAVEIGTSGSEATNGFTISDTILEGTGSSNLTSELSGTWDAEAPLAANTIVSIATSGTNPVVANNNGKARVTILFNRINRAPSPALPGGPALP